MIHRALPVFEPDYGASQWIDAVKAGLPGHNDFDQWQPRDVPQQERATTVWVAFLINRLVAFLRAPKSAFHCGGFWRQPSVCGQGANAGQCFGRARQFLAART